MSYITKRKPQTIDNIYKALFDAKEKNTVTIPDQNPLRPSTQAAIASTFTSFDIACNARVLARQVYRANTNAKAVVIKKLRVYVSHYFQNLNRTIEREVATFTPDVRTFYSLEENQTALPSLAKETDVLLWAQKIVQGETNRIAVTGGPAMAFPSVGEVAALLADANAKRMAQTVAYDAYNTTQEGLQALKTDALAVISSVWAEVESAFVNDPDAGSRRAKAAQWGVVYVSVNEAEAKVKVMVTDQVSGEPIEGAEVFFEAADLDLLTDNTGLAEGATTYVGADTVRIDKAGYTVYTIAVEFAGAGEVFELAVSLEPEVV